MSLLTLINGGKRRVVTPLVALLVAGCSSCPAPVPLRDYLDVRDAANWFLRDSEERRCWRNPDLCEEGRRLRASLSVADRQVLDAYQRDDAGDLRRGLNAAFSALAGVLGLAAKAER